jgi:hypothetical protein
MYAVNNYDKIDKLRAELAKAEAERDKFEMLREDKRLATIIHEDQCHWNHTDGCGWFYNDEKDPTIWVKDTTRARYLKKANDLLAVVDYDTALKVMKALKGL